MADIGKYRDGIDIRVVSFNGTTLRDDQYDAWLDTDDTPFDAAVEPKVIPTGGRPVLARTVEQPKIIAIRIDILETAEPRLSQESLRGIFARGVEGPIVVEFGASNRTLTATVLGHETSYKGVVSAFRATLIAADARWKAQSQSSTATAVTASGQTFSITNAGTIADLAPIIDVKATSAKTAANAYTKRRRVIVVNRSDRKFTSEPIDLTGGGWDTAAEVTATEMQADGDDLRVFLTGREVPRWFGGGGINSTTTSVYNNLDLEAKLETRLLAAITAGSPANGGNLDVSVDVQEWPREGYMYIPSSGECIRYGAIADADEDPQFQNVTRGARGTTAASAAAGAKVYWVEHDISIVYGHSAAVAPDDASARQPLIDLTNSTNYKHVWENFTDDTFGYDRSANWSRALLPLDSRAGSILAASGKPATQMSLEYQKLGARAEKPNFNTWRKFVPQGIAPKPQIRKSISGSATATTTATVTVPTEIEIDDIRYIWIAARAGSLPTITTPSGYTLVRATSNAATMRAALYWKRVTAPFSEGDVAVTISTSSSVAWVSWAQRGTHKTVPIDVENVAATASGTSHATPNVTTTKDKALVLCCYAVDASSTWTPPSGFTEEADVQPAAAAPAVMVCYKTQNALGATGAQTGVSSGTGAGVAQIAGITPLAGLTLTRVVPSDLALRVLGTDGDGASVEVEDLLGALTSASVIIDPADKPLYVVDLYGRSQIVDKNRHPEAALAAEPAVYSNIQDRYSNATGALSTAEQKFVTTGVSEILQKVRVTVLWATGGGTLFGRIAPLTRFGEVSGTPDEPYPGSGAGVSNEASVAVTANAAAQEAELDFTDVELLADTTYYLHLRVSTETGTPTWSTYWGRYSEAETLAYTRAFKLISARMAIKDGVHATDVQTITIDSVTIEHDPEGVPYVVFGAEEAIYHQNGVLSNDTTGQTITFDTLCALNDTLRIDVASRTVTNITTDEDVSHTVAWSDEDGLRVAAGANTFSWTEAGMVADTVTVKHYGTWE